MRISLLLAAFALVAFPAAAQTDYETIADEASLIDGVLADVDISCMAQLPSGDFVFYNFPTGDLVTHDPDAAPGSRTAILRSSAQLNADLNSEADGCFAITVDGAGNVYAAIQDSSDVDQVYKTDGLTGSVLAAADGLTGIAVTGSTVYLARVAFFGAPEDGFYSVNTTGTGQTPAVVLTDSGLDLIDLAVGSDGSLYASSSEFGSSGGGLQNVVVKVTDPAGTPSLSVVYDPFADGVFTNGTDGGLEDLELAAGTDRLYLFNNSFAADNGEQWGTALSDGTGGEQFADEAALLADPDTDLTEFTPPGGRSMVLNGDEIFVASRTAFGGQDQIVKLTGFPPVSVGDNFEIDANPETQTVTAPGTANFTYTVTNNTASAQSGVVFYQAFLGSNPVSPVVQVQSGSLNGMSSSPTLSFSVGVPGSAPAGLYTVAISAGPNTGTAVATDEVTVIIPASRAVAGGSAEWTLVDAQPWPALEAAARTSALGAFPNPFADRTEIGFELEASARVELVVYDVRGREVATLANDVLAAGQHSVEFDAASLPSGVYIYRLVTGTQVETGRMTLVK